MDIWQTHCPRCKRVIKQNSGYDGEGGVDYCCEYAFYWSREWAVDVTKDNQRSYDEMIASQSAAKE